MTENLKVLLVDDDQLVLGTVQEMLSDLGHVVTTATDGEKALNKLQDNRYDLLITDVIMPVKEGIETVAEAKHVQPDIRVIAISGGGRTKNYDFLNLALKIGANAALQKPFNKQSLEESIAKAMG